MQARVQKWDILKFELIFLVVLGHAADFYTGSSEIMRHIFFFIYSFHMPVFLYVSGLFAKRTVNDKRYDKMFGYLIIYFLLKVIFALYRYTKSGIISLNLFKEDALPWYMFVLFAFPLITSAVKNIKPQYVLLFNVCLAILSGYDGNIGDQFVLSRMIVFFPFFYLGYLTDVNKLQEITDKKWIKVLSVMVLLAAAAVVFLYGAELYRLRGIFTGRNPFSVLGKYRNWGFLARILCYCASTVLGFALIAITPNRTPFGLIAKMGQNTLAVYAFHCVVLYYLYDYLDFAALLEKVFPQYTTLAVVGVSFVLTVILSIKVFSVPLNWLMSLPKKAVKPKS